MFTHILIDPQHAIYIVRDPVIGTDFIRASYDYLGNENGASALRPFDGPAVGGCFPATSQLIPIQKEVAVDERTPVQKWVDALRSGDYQQAQRRLTILDDAAPNGARHCCLGVACDLFVKEHPDVLIVEDVPDDSHGIIRRYENSGGVLPQPVIEWLGLQGESGGFERGDRSLAADNDQGASFEKIADIIESRPEGLFVDTRTPAEKWVDALRSGRFQQTKGVLTRYEGEEEEEASPKHCCLGVACEVFREEFPYALDIGTPNSNGIVSYGETTTVLPPKVQEWLGLRTCEGQHDWDAESDHAPQMTLTSLNDDAGLSFAEIADRIEARPAGLFGAAE